MNCDLETVGPQQLRCRREGCGRLVASAREPGQVNARCRAMLANKRRGPCVHLGEQTGERSCQSCGGNVRVKLFDCHHPQHQQAEWRYCLERCPHYVPADLGPATPGAELPLVFSHGLGDAVQFGIVLRHLDAAGLRPRVYTRPEHLAAFRSWPAAPLAKAEYGARLLDWPEPAEVYGDSPSTKAEQYLRRVFGITPRPELCRYVITPTEAEHQAAADLRQRLGPFAFIHYRGASSTAWKNLDEAAIRQLVAFLRAQQITPLVLDLDQRSTLPDARPTTSCSGCHGGPVLLRGDDPIWQACGFDTAGQLAAIAAAARVCVGIDSGPGHVMGSIPASGTGSGNATPAVICWTRNHPLHYYALADHVTHLVPENHRQALRTHDDGQRDAALDYFAGHYDGREYRDLAGMLLRVVAEKLKPHNRPGLIAWGEHWVRDEHRAADQVIIRDIYQQDAYRLAALRPPRKVRSIVDVGAHVGAFAKRAADLFLQARIVCVEANPANLPALEINLAELPPAVQKRGAATGRAEAIAAACTYEPQAWLHSSVFPGSANTGGSFCAPAPAVPELANADEYRPAGRVPTITLEEIARRQRWQRIDLLKLDCEGAELSILEHAPLDLLGIIVGEYHDAERFRELVARRFPADAWQVQLRPSSESMGLFTISRMAVDHRRG